MKVSRVTWVFVILVLGLVDAARRRVRSTTAAPATITTTPASYVDSHSAFTRQTEDLENLWDKFDIQKLDSRLEASWDNPNGTQSEHHDEIILSRQYPGLPENSGDSNELPSPISPPVRPILPPQQPAPGCLGLRGQYPSPKSCANYLNCWDDVVVEQTCPTGLLFNDVAGYCDFDYNVNCGNRPPATPKPPMSPGSKICPDPNGRYRSSTNCSEFYVCLVGRPIKFNCSSGLVYNDILNVCDYPYKVNCKGAATPKPPKPTNLPTQPPQPPSHPPYAPQPPTYAPQPPTYAPPPPSYQPQPQPQPQPPSYQPQPQPQPQPPKPKPKPQPPKPPSYQPQPYPPAPPSYFNNPWLNKIETDPWHQRQPATQLDIDQETRMQEAPVDGQPTLSNPTDVTETSTLTNPWTVFQVIPPELMNAPCTNGDVHRLNDSCTSVVVCRNNRPQIMRCSVGFSYDKPSDSCRPFSIAKC